MHHLCTYTIFTIIGTPVLLIIQSVNHVTAGQCIKSYRYRSREFILNQTMEWRKNYDLSYFDRGMFVGVKWAGYRKWTVEDRKISPGPNFGKSVSIVASDSCSQQNLS